MLSVEFFIDSNANHKYFSIFMEQQNYFDFIAIEHFCFFLYGCIYFNPKMLKKSAPSQASRLLPIIHTYYKGIT